MAVKSRIDFQKDENESVTLSISISGWSSKDLLNLASYSEKNFSIFCLIVSMTCIIMLTINNRQTRKVIPTRSGIPHR
jgi:hypothetical protein